MCISIYICVLLSRSHPLFLSCFHCVCLCVCHSATHFVCHRDTCKNICIISTELMHKKYFVSIEKGRKKRATQVRYCVSAAHCRLCFVLAARIALSPSRSCSLERVSTSFCVRTHINILTHSLTSFNGTNTFKYIHVAKKKIRMRHIRHTDNSINALVPYIYVRFNYLAPNCEMKSQ